MESHVKNNEIELNKKHLVVVVLLFTLWSVPILLVNRSDIWISGIPLLWFYYITLSLTIFAVLVLMYIFEYRKKG